MKVNATVLTEDLAQAPAQGEHLVNVNDDE